MKRQNTVTLRALEISELRSHDEDFLKTRKSMKGINETISKAMTKLKEVEEEDFDSLTELCYDISKSANKAKRVKRNETYLGAYGVMLVQNMEPKKWYSKENLLNFLEFDMDKTKKDPDFDKNVCRHTHIFEVCIDRLVNGGKIMVQYSTKYGQIYSLVE